MLLRSLGLQSHGVGQSQSADVSSLEAIWWALSLDITVEFPRRGKSWLTAINVLGPLARIGPNHLVTDDVDLLRHMSAARSVYTRSDWYDGMKLDPNVNNVISERNDQRHTALRAKMAAGV